MRQKCVLQVDSWEEKEQQASDSPKFYNRSDILFYIRNEHIYFFRLLELLRSIIKVMKQNMSLDMNRHASIPNGVPKYSQKYKDVLERAYKRDQSLKARQKLFFYRVRSIGVGAHSLVYQVYQQTSGTLFAQKSISKKTIQPELITQIKLHLSLNHFNIVNLYHIYSEQAYVKMIMDYGGDSLFTQRKKNKLPTIMKQQLIVSILKQLISAVSYLHSKKIVHADIKLQNILYLDGVVKLCDFGYAHIAKDQKTIFKNEAFGEIDIDSNYSAFQYNSKNKQNQTIQQNVVGTLEYLDPEYVQGKSSQFSRDIWALGIVAYELCTGKNPFDNMTQNQKWSMILKIKQISLNNLGTSLSKDMRKLLECTLCPIQKRATIKQIERLELFNHEQYQKKIIQKWELAFIQ